MRDTTRIEMLAFSLSMGKAGMLEKREAEIRQNFHFFQGVVSQYMGEHAGEFALLRHRAVVGFFARPYDAMKEGHDRFDDELFSVQRVVDRPLDLGFLSYASGERVTM